MAVRELMTNRNSRRNHFQGILSAQVQNNEKLAVGQLIEGGVL